MNKNKFIEMLDEAKEGLMAEMASMELKMKKMAEKLKKERELNKHRIKEIKEWHDMAEQYKAEAIMWESKFEQAEMKSKAQKWEKEKEMILAEREAMNKKDEWSSRVTYENVVEQIAACEDAKERDEGRKLIEPLLKKSQVTSFRRDIKKRVKELNEDSGATINNYGTYNDIHPDRQIIMTGTTAVYNENQ